VRGVGPAGGSQHERQRVIDPLHSGSCRGPAAHRDLLHSVQGQDGRAPAPLRQQVGRVVDAGPQARPSLRRPPDRGTDVVGMHVGAQPEGLHGLAQRHVVAAPRLPRPRDVIEAIEHLVDTLGDLIELARQLGRRSATPLGRLAFGHLGRALALSPSRGDVGEGADQVGDDIADRPPLTAARRRELALVERAHQVSERQQLLMQALDDFLSRQHGRSHLVAGRIRPRLNSWCG